MSLAYLATPYTKFDEGLDAAFEVASQLGARLLQSGVFVYAPIVHLHPMAKHGRLDPLNLSLWYPHNDEMMKRCDSLIVAQMPTWENSAGMAVEIEYFLYASKPIFDLDPNTMRMTKRSPASAPSKYERLATEGASS
jgi:uncharacterized protein DUF1937